MRRRNLTGCGVRHFASSPRSWPPLVKIVAAWLTRRASICYCACAQSVLTLYRVEFLTIMVTVLIRWPEPQKVYDVLWFNARTKFKLTKGTVPNVRRSEIS